MTTCYTYNSTTKALAPAPAVLTIDGKVVVNPSVAQYATIFAYPLGSAPAPEPPEGKVAVRDGYELQNGKWVPTYRYDDAPAPVPPPPRTFSKLKLYAALASANLWDPLMSWLAEQTYNGMNAKVAFELAQDLTEDHPLFAQWLAAAKTALGATDEQVSAILEAATIS